MAIAIVRPVGFEPVEFVILIDAGSAGPREFRAEGSLSHIDASVHCSLAYPLNSMKTLVKTTLAIRGTV